MKLNSSQNKRKNNFSITLKSQSLNTSLNSSPQKRSKTKLTIEERSMQVIAEQNQMKKLQVKLQDIINQSKKSKKNMRKPIHDYQNQSLPQIIFPKKETTQVSTKMNQVDASYILFQDIESQTKRVEQLSSIKETKAKLIQLNLNEISILPGDDQMEQNIGNLGSSQIIRKKQITPILGQNQMVNDKIISEIDNLKKINLNTPVKQEFIIEENELIKKSDTFLDTDLFSSQDKNLVAGADYKFNKDIYINQQYRRASVQLKNSQTMNFDALRNNQQFKDQQRWLRRQTFVGLYADNKYSTERDTKFLQIIKENSVLNQSIQLDDQNDYEISSPRSPKLNSSKISVIYNETPEYFETASRQCKITQFIDKNLEAYYPSSGKNRDDNIKLQYSRQAYQRAKKKMTTDSKIVFSNFLDKKGHNVSIPPLKDQDYEKSNSVSDFRILQTIIKIQPSEKQYQYWLKKLNERINLLEQKLSSERDICRPLINHMVEVYINFIQSIHQKDINSAIDIYSTIMDQCQQINHKQLFVKMTVLLGEFFYDINDYNKSSFFLRQAILCATILKLINEVVLCLIIFIKISIRLKEYEQAIIISNQALYYSWYINRMELELQIYDLMGLALIYNSQVDMGTIVHMKFMNGIIEPKDSFIRIGCINKIKDKLKQCEVSDVIDNKVLSRLSLPFINRFDTVMINNKITHPKCDQFKTQSYKNCKALVNIAMLLDQSIFQIVEIDLNSLKQSGEYYNSEQYQLFQSMKTSVQQQQSLQGTKDQAKIIKNPNAFYYVGSLHSQLPPTIVDLKKKYLKKLERYNTKNIHDGLHKLGIDIQVRHRNIQKYDSQSVYNRVQNFVGGNKQIGNTIKKDQIYIKHLNNPDFLNIPDKFYIKKYRVLFEHMIIDLF